MTADTHLLVPIKPLHQAKSRLLGAADGNPTRTRRHADLVAAVALDTVAAAVRGTRVAGIVVVTSDTELAESFEAIDVEVLPDTPRAGLNAALRHGDSVLRNRAPEARVGALQADLPALRSDELDAALRAAGDGRAFCADRHGTGTTLLLAEPGQALDPLFGPGSAARHEEGHARRLVGAWHSLRCDVDTEADLRTAADLGIGPHTRARLSIGRRGSRAANPATPAAVDREPEGSSRS